MFPGRTLEPLAGDLESFLSFLKAFLSIIGRPFMGKCWNPQRVMSHEIKVMPEENCRFIYFVPHGKPPKIQSLVVLPRFPSVEALCILATFICIMHKVHLFLASAHCFSHWFLSCISISESAFRISPHSYLLSPPLLPFFQDTFMILLFGTLACLKLTFYLHRPFFLGLCPSSSSWLRLVF